MHRCKTLRVKTGATVPNKIAHRKRGIDMNIHRVTDETWRTFPRTNIRSRRWHEMGKKNVEQKAQIKLSKWKHKNWLEHGVTGRIQHKTIKLATLHIGTGHKPLNVLRHVILWNMCDWRWLARRILNHTHGSRLKLKNPNLFYINIDFCYCRYLLSTYFVYRVDSFHTLWAEFLLVFCSQHPRFTTSYVRTPIFAITRIFISTHFVRRIDTNHALQVDCSNVLGTLLPPYHWWCTATG